MADAFAPQLSSEVRFNQPVETPSMLGAVAELGGNFISAFADSRQARGGSAATSVDPNLAMFRQGLDRVEAIRNDKGEVAAQIAERQLAKNFAMNGINLNEDYKQVYETSTGRPWQGYGMDVEAQMLQETLKDPQVQASYTASWAVNKDWTEEQRLEYAIGQKAQMTAMENEINRSKQEANYKWTTQSESAYGGAIDTFVNISLGGMATNSAQGGRIGPQDIANLGASWAQLKMNLTRPSNVSDDQWKAIQSKIDSVDATLVAFEKAGSNETLLNEITSAFSNSMLQGGEGSPESVLAAMTAIKDPATLTNLMGGNVEKFIMGIGGNLKLDVSTPNLFGHIVSDQGGVGPNPDPNSFLNTLPAEVKTKIEGKTPEQIYNGLEASGLLTSVVKPNDLNRPEARQQFTENAATIGAVMQATGSDTYLSNDFLKKLVANPGFIRNISSLEAIDPEAATVARTYVRSGLNVEMGKQVQNLGAIDANLESKGIVWNGTDYVTSPTADASRNAPFLARGRMFSDPLVSSADAINQAKDRRAAINTINMTMKELAVPVAGQEAAMTEAPTPTTTAGSGYRIPEEVAQDQEFIGAAGKLATDLSIPVDDVFRVIEFETAGSWSPAIKNPGSTATGLIQFLESTAKGLGTTTADLAGMTRAQQMEYVGKYLEPYKGRIKNFGDLYMAVHYPKAIGQSETYVMYSQGSAEYAANKNLDTNGDGTVTRGETVASVIARTGGGRGVMTTPATAQTQAFAAEATQDIGSVLPPSGGSAPAAPAATETPAASTSATTADMPVDFSNAATGTMPQEQAPVPQAVDTEVQDLINNLSSRTRRQLRLAGIEPNEVKFYETEEDAQAAIEAGDLVEGMAFVLPDGSVRLVEGE